MNKETFSRYGSLIAVVLVLAVMITLAAPFGNAIASGVNNFVNGFGNAMNGDTGGGGGSGSSGIKLDAPTNLTLANNQLNFDLVPNANQYILYVNDEVSATYATSPIDVSTHIETYGTPITFKLVASDSTGVYGNSAATEYIAAGDGKMVLKAGTYRFNDVIVTDNDSFGSVDDYAITFVYNQTVYNYLVYQYDHTTYDLPPLDLEQTLMSFAITVEDGDLPIYHLAVNFGEVESEYPGYLTPTPVEITLTSAQVVNNGLANFIISNTNYNKVNGGTGDEDSVLGLRRFKETMTPIEVEADANTEEILSLYGFDITPLDVDGMVIKRISCFIVVTYEGETHEGFLMGCEGEYPIQSADKDLMFLIVNQFTVTATANSTVDEWLLANTEPVTQESVLGLRRLKATPTPEGATVLPPASDPITTEYIENSDNYIKAEVTEYGVTAYILPVYIVDGEDYLFALYIFESEDKIGDISNGTAVYVDSSGNVTTNDMSNYLGFDFTVYHSNNNAWVLANTEPVEAGEEEGYVIEAGTYRFNDISTFTNELITNAPVLEDGWSKYPFVATFTHNDDVLTTEHIGFQINNEAGAFCLFFNNNDGCLLGCVDGAESTGWLYPDLMIHTVSEDQEVDATFYEWYTANTKRVIEVDELPTENVDTNAIYKVNEFTENSDTSTLIGTWVFNENIEFDSLYYYSTEFQIDFTSKGEAFVGIYLEEYQDPTGCIEGVHIYYCNDYMISAIEEFYDYTYYPDDAYKIVTITGGNDINDETLISWIQSNARKYNVTTTYYQYVDGAWVEQ